MNELRYCLDCDKQLPKEYKFKRCERCRNERIRKPLGKKNLMSGFNGVKTASKVVKSSSIKATKFVWKKIKSVKRDKEN